MDSINAQQPENNRQDFDGAAAAQRIKDMGEAAQSCFFCTAIQSGAPVSVRPMSVQKIDDAGICWFLSASDSHKNAELESDPSMQLLFQGSKHSDFLTLYGTGQISRDHEKIKELWEPIVKTWFTEGVDDPRITVIKFIPSQGYYWDTKHGTLVAFAKMAVGAMIGKTLDDSIEGTLRP